jgi:hypothetical protein
VILQHNWPNLHWDLLLEAGGVLRAWRLLSEPRAECCVAAEPNFDHRLTYLDYEGEISGGRGIVSRWDAGLFIWIADEPERVAFQLRGERFSARAEIKRDGAGWLFRLREAV